MASSTKPKTVFITGCSSGIGLAAVQLFHSEGWNVVATMRKPAECPAELLKINPQERLLITRLDVQDIPSIEGAVKEALEKFGKVDVLVNNAGFAQQGLFEALTREQIQAQFDVNVFGELSLPDYNRGLLTFVIHRRHGRHPCAPPTLPCAGWWRYHHGLVGCRLLVFTALHDVQRLQVCLGRLHGGTLVRVRLSEHLRQVRRPTRWRHANRLHAACYDQNPSSRTTFRLCPIPDKDLGQLQ